MNLKRVLAAALLAAWALTAAALPSVDEVQAQVQKGNFAQAESMMHEVVAAKPGSARAHYIYAEILAHDKRFDDAAREAASARRIDPAIGFTDAAKFKTLEDLLRRETQAARVPATTVAPPPQLRYSAPAVERSSGLPGWVWALGLAGVAALVFSMVRRRTQPAMMAMGGVSPAGYAPGPAGYGPGYGPQGGGGSGLLGVGLAAAGGVAAGMLAEKMLEGHRDPGAGALSSGGSGYVPGMFDDARGDDAAARELESRPVDFGNGDGWGGGDGGGSFDGGGGGDDGGGW